MAEIIDLGILTGIASGDWVPVWDTSAATAVRITQADLLGGSGTWTPALRFGGATTGITYGTQVGNYVRAGTLVWVDCRIVLTSKGSATGVATIAGLPFANTGGLTPVSLVLDALASNATMTQAMVASGASTINLYFMASAYTAIAQMTNAHASNTLAIYLAGVYRTS